MITLSAGHCLPFRPAATAAASAPLGAARVLLALHLQQQSVSVLLAPLTMHIEPLKLLELQP